MSLFSFQSQRAALHSGMVSIVWRNADKTLPKGSTSLMSPFKSEFVLQHCLCTKLHNAFNSFSEFGDRTSMALCGLHREPDIQVMRVVTRWIRFILLWFLDSCFCKTHTSDIKSYISLTLSVITYQVFE